MKFYLIWFFPPISVCHSMGRLMLVLLLVFLLLFRAGCYAIIESNGVLFILKLKQTVFAISLDVIWWKTTAFDWKLFSTWATRNMTFWKKAIPWKMWQSQMHVYSITPFRVIGLTRRCVRCVRLTCICPCIVVVAFFYSILFISFSSLLFQCFGLSVVVDKSRLTPIARLTEWISIENDRFRNSTHYCLS